MWSAHRKGSQTSTPSSNKSCFAHARISVHHGKTQVWNRGGVEPQDIDIITAEARIRVPRAVVWREAQELPATRQGLKVLGAPIGHPQYVQEFLRRKSEEQQVLFQRIPLVNDPQASWLLLWMCASTRANFWLRMVSPELTLPFAELHDRYVWQCLQTVLDVREAPAEAQQLASLPLTLGGLGVASAERTRHAAHWASWANCLAMVQQRHPSVAEEMIVGLDRDLAPCLAAVRHCREVLAEANFHPPGWRGLGSGGSRPCGRSGPNQPKFGWQQCASRSLETKHLNERVWPGMTDAERALLRSQRGPLASAAVTALPTSRATRMDGQPFRILLLRRLRLPLPLSSRTCRCGRQLDPLGHHRAACPEAGVLGRRGFPLEVAAAQVCREAGARVTTNIFVRDMDLAVVNVMDSRRLEVVADGLTAFRGAQLAIDTTLVSAIRRDGTARPGAATRAGVALAAARRTREDYPELTGEGGEPAWWFWLLRLGADGRRRLLSSLLPCPTQRRSQSQNSSEAVWPQHGCDDGARCWLAVRRRLSPSPCLVGRRQGAATTSLLRRRW